ncbi:MAG: T6SS phospholipase effector Tle1-like catalytic domain-containing protein [Plesiomonas sp.]|uniref:T6SS phospholipase effector Tle1-like catalytic domain-containing protein n=1 Tax=Plesiomonas sp. TaxID=2486279 RepID=UPI003F36E599
MMSSDPYCIPCEKYDRWIELDIRDENNHAFSGQKAILTDSTGMTKTVTLTDSPIQVWGFAVGPVTVKLETQPWLKMAQSRETLKEGQTSQIPAYTDYLSGYTGIKREHCQVTTGDLCLTQPEKTLPKGHNAGEAQTPRFITNHSYVIEVKGYKLGTLRIGVFFDGTGNNTANTQNGLAKVEQWLAHTCSNPAQKEKELRACQVGQLPVNGSAANDVTNVGKLFSLYDLEAEKLISHCYISGIGTRDPVSGKKEKEYRTDDTITQGLDLDFSGENTSIIGKVTEACQLRIIKAIDDDLKNVLPEIEYIHRIVFDVFGFSRGAAAARHFVNVIDQKDDHPLVKAVTSYSAIRLKVGFDWANRQNVRIAFVGLFDTVKSSFNPNVNIRLHPQSAERVVHLTAQDEVRKHFPLSRITDDSAGTSIPPHFTEVALPGSHSDIGGGYYSRWSLNNPNSDPALTECIELERFMSEENVQTPYSDSRAYQQAKAYADEKVAIGWVNRIHPYLSRTATPPLNAISLIAYSYTRPQGKDSPWPKKAVYVEVIMNRIVEGEYSRIPLHIMVEAGRASGVPLKEWTSKNRTLQLGSLSEKITIVNLEKLDQHWAQSAIEQGVVKNLVYQLPHETYRALRRDYLHHSASNQGIANPANLNKNGNTVSKERRDLIGNQET